MKNKPVQIERSKEKAGLTAATLPWWARILIAQHAEAVSSQSALRYIHHCSDCGCVLISTHTAFQYFPDICPECDKKNRSSQGGN